MINVLRTKLLEFRKSYPAKWFCIKAFRLLIWKGIDENGLLRTLVEPI